MSKHSLYAWKGKFATAASGETGKDPDIRMLKRELAWVCEERDISKKPPRISLGMPSGIRVCGRASLAFSVRAMCRCLPLQPGGFYAWLQARVSVRAREDRRQPELLHNARSESGKVCGYRKPHDDLIDQGESICLNRIGRLAQVAGIKAQSGYKRRRGSYGGKPSVVVGQYPRPEVQCRGPGQGLGHLHNLHPEAGGLRLPRYGDRSLCPARDRMVDAKQADTGAVLQAPHMSVWRHKPKGKVLIHSDQGSQFTSMG